MANQDPIDNWLNLKALESQKNQGLKIIDEFFNGLKKGFDAVNSIQIQLGANSTSSGFSELKKQSEETTKQMGDNARSYTALWKQLLKERDDAERAANAARIADQKRIAAEERELNKLIAAEEKVLLAQSRAERRAAIAERKQADKDYQNTWKVLLKERDDAERNSQVARKKAAAEAVSKVAIDSNVALSKTLTDLRFGYDRLTKAERENINIGGVLLSRIKELDTQLKATDAATGRYGRSVGDYGKATTNIQRQIAMFAGELPNLQYGLRTFASSLSNQFQGLFEAITQAKNANKLLREDGQKTIPVARQIVSGIFNWQTGLMALVAAGGLLITWLTSSTKAEKEMSEATKENTESQKRLAETIGKEVAELNLLVMKSQDVTRNFKERSDAIDDLQKKFPEYFSSLSRESILNGNVAAAVDLATEAIIRKARETQRVEKYTKAITELAAMENELQDLMNPAKGTFVYDDQNRTGSLNAQIAAQREKVKQLEKTLLTQNEVNANEAYWLDTNKKKQYEANQQKEKANALLTEEERKERDRLAKQKPKADKFTDEKEAINAAKSIAESEEMTFSQRYDAAVRFSQLSDSLLKKQNKHSIDNIIIYATEADKLFKKINDDRAKAMAEHQKQIEAESKEIMRVLLDQMNNVAQNENNQRETRLKDLANDLSNQKITLTQYNSEKERINAETDAAILKNQRDALSDYLSAQGLLPDEISKIQEVITNIENTESQKRIAIAEREARLKQDAQKRLTDLEIELGQKVLDFTAAAFDRRYEKQLRDLSNTREVSDEKYEKEREAIENAGYLEEEKIARLKVLDAERFEAQKQIEEQEKTIKRKRDIAERVKGNIDIISSTLIAEVQALTYLSNPITAPLYPGIAAAIAAIGGANLAILNSQPLPEYATGKDPSDPYTGPMEWGEAGTEAKVDRFGNITFATKRTRGFTEMGDTILSNAELKSGALSDYLPSEMKDIKFTELINATAEIQSDNTKKIVKAIQKIPRSESVSANVLKAQMAASR